MKHGTPTQPLLLPALVAALALTIATAAAAAPASAEAGAAPESAVEGAERRAANPWFQAGRAAVAKRGAHLAAAGLQHRRAKNVVLFVGDGMGISTVTAARIFAGQLRGETGEENTLAFEQLPFTGLVKVYNTNMQTPDSAGTMSAIVTGVKTQGGVLAVDENIINGDYKSTAASRVPTLMEEAETRGMATGVISTTRITHATPGACYAHSPSRNFEADADLPEAAREAGFPDIARQLIEFQYGDGIDVILGGGRRNFIPETQPDPQHPEKTGRRLDGRDLSQEWLDAAPGRAYVQTARQFAALPRDARQVLGLFSHNLMAFEGDRGDAEPSLSEMTARAIQLLSKNPAGAQHGFVLMVEGAHIDSAHHMNNARRALEDTLELAAAVKRARELTNPAETLIVVTADHSHPFSIVGYAARGNPIFGLAHMPDLQSGGAEAQPVPDGTGLPYEVLHYAAGPGNSAPTKTQPEGAKKMPRGQIEYAAPARPTRPDLREVDTQARDHLQYAAIPGPEVAGGRGVHSGEDVGVWAGGPGAPLFTGALEQNELYHAITAALGWWKAEERAAADAESAEAGADSADEAGAEAGA